ncbi:MAG TPA: SPOR domain-containing protein [Candidatus Udaeobacter sp.]|nr:SPOR domain-containing protein [Candidatus Udaeobacter sp.]
MKPTGANIDKEEVRWSLSWHPDGRCDSFTREAILACAPPTSGVYGLFNFDCQVFIGESANIQEALLNHESETVFQPRHLQPTGFTFECCAAELRKPKADALIARFHPVLQREAAMTERWSPSNGPMVSETGLRHQKLETYADHREKSPKVRRRFYFTRAQAAALAAMFVASAVIIFYLGTPSGENIQEGVNGAGEKPDVHASASTADDSVRFAAKSASAGEEAAVQSALETAGTGPIAHFAESAGLSKKWSVQISAAPAKDIADNLVQRLKANGYDAYVVQAEVNGQTYYRVRVGRFDAREEAESARQSLARQEGYRDAYLTGN